MIPQESWPADVRFADSKRKELFTSMYCSRTSATYAKSYIHIQKILPLTPSISGRWSTKPSRRTQLILKIEK